jgi:hypothetical protein
VEYSTATSTSPGGKAAASRLFTDALKAPVASFSNIKARMAALLFVQRSVVCTMLSSTAV